MGSFTNSLELMKLAGFRTIPYTQRQIPSGLWVGLGARLAGDLSLLYPSRGPGVRVGQVESLGEDFGIQGLARVTLVQHTAAKKNLAEFWSGKLRCHFDIHSNVTILLNKLKLQKNHHKATALLCPLSFTVY